ncbi:uncharacterized protein F5147DRAFT_781459 [Suillus discolor]|uniref:Uncharacterized protein n=1 Tax=Suillus discolor TaxID=1912936 RepID=A0A9P7ETA8_9AGAM|nr:uncharacterized protein F5147DRAFT_781459 [Suillus discolor]KAG2087034.1 hypothetical protein F5147DRAFT_781459 [Suillus discolor]
MSPITRTHNDHVDSARRRSARQLSRIQTTAYPLGARKEQAPEGQLTNQEPLEKVEFRIPLNTTDTNKTTTYVDHFYAESDLSPLDMFDSMRAAMNLPKTYEHLGWRLSTARRTDPPHRLLTSQDIKSAFKAARAEQLSGRQKKKVAIEVVNTQMPVLKGTTKQHASTTRSAGEQNHLPSTSQSFDDEAFRMSRKEGAASLQHVPTELISPIIHNHVHIPSAINDTWASESTNGVLSSQQRDSSMAPRPLKRTYALYLESDEDTGDEEPPQGINEVLANIHSRYPDMNLPQYVKTLKEHGIFYLPTATHFNSRFYVEKVGMSEGAAFTFHTFISKAHMKDGRAKARSKAKGKNRARASDNKENFHAH